MVYIMDNGYIRRIGYVLEFGNSRITVNEKKESRQTELDVHVPVCTTTRLVRVFENLPRKINCENSHIKHFNK